MMKLFYEKKLNNKGESLIIAMVLLLVLMIVGVYVLSSAFMSISASNSKSEELQAHYYAQSVLEVINKSINEENGIGAQIIADIQNQSFVVTNRTLSPTITSSIAGINEFKIEDASITYSSNSVVIKQNNGIVQSRSLTVDNALFTYTIVYNKTRYTLKATYSYIGWGEFTKSDGWRWNGTWQLVNVEK